MNRSEQIDKLAKEIEKDKPTYPISRAISRVQNWNPLGIGDPRYFNEVALPTSLKMEKEMKNGTLYKILKALNSPNTVPSDRAREGRKNMGKPLHRWGTEKKLNEERESWERYARLMDGIRKKKGIIKSWSETSKIQKEVMPFHFFKDFENISDRMRNKEISPEVMKKLKAIKIKKSKDK